MTFDPTPAAGKTEPVSTGFTAQVGKYAEALELIWFQYVVGYDRQEQRSLATSLHNQLFVYRRLFVQIASAVWDAVSKSARGIALIGLAVMAAILLFFVARRVRRFGWRRGLRLARRQGNKETSAVVFYERWLALLERRGVKRDPNLTPLEFAGGLDFKPALFITRAYNRVRFGGQALTSAEFQEIEKTLAEFERATE